MDYEKKYKEALERAEKIYHSEFKPDEAAVLTEYLPMIFPELKEGEDERIRKELIEQIAYIIPNDDEVDDEGNALPSYQERINKYRVWLKKQGQNKSADYECPHWISVRDGYPEMCVSVLTTTLHGTQRVGFYEGGWWLANSTDLVRMGSITHWMPLPAPPHHFIDANKKVDRVIGTADHIKTALDVLNKEGDKE